jgi:hypothetical protein
MFMLKVGELLKDQLGDQIGEWMRAIKILHKGDELDYAPKSTPNPSTHDGEPNRQDRIVTIELPTLGTIIGIIDKQAEAKHKATQHLAKSARSARTVVGWTVR